MCEDLILSSSRASPLPHVLMSFLVVICKCVNVCVLCMQICMYMVRVCARARVSVYPFAVFVGVVSWCHTQTQYCVCVYARAYKYILCTPCTDMCLHADARARACADEAHTPRAQGKMCDQSALEPYKLGGGKQVTAVYEYWSKKRSKLGKALIRRMQPPTPASHIKIKTKAYLLELLLNYYFADFTCCT